MKKTATLITSLESKPKVLFLWFFLHLKSWDLLTSIHQNEEEFPFRSAHFENGNFRNLSDDGTVTAINWFLKKQETEHNVPTAGNVKYIILMIAENFAKGPGVVQVKFFGVIGTFDIQTMKTTYKIEYFFVLDYILIVSPWDRILWTKVLFIVSFLLFFFLIIMEFEVPLYGKKKKCIVCGCAVGTKGKSHQKKAISVGMEKVINFWISSGIIIHYNEHKLFSTSHRIQNPFLVPFS